MTQSDRMTELGVERVTRVACGLPDPKTFFNSPERVAAIHAAKVAKSAAIMAAIAAKQTAQVAARRAVRQEKRRAIKAAARLMLRATIPAHLSEDARIAEDARRAKLRAESKAEAKAEAKARAAERREAKKAAEKLEKERQQCIKAAEWREKRRKTGRPAAMLVARWAAKRDGYTGSAIDNCARRLLTKYGRVTTDWDEIASLIFRQYRGPGNPPESEVTERCNVEACPASPAGWRRKTS